MAVLLFLAVGWLAFANGANDNFKGVATLYGSGTTSRGRALWWSTLTTLGGSLVSIVLGAALVRTFSGSGLVPPEIAAGTTFRTSIGGAAAVTILLATRLGMPTSTTHALTGALLGVALVVDGGRSAWEPLSQKVFLPLLLSPIAAIALTSVVFPMARAMHARFLPAKPRCVCVEHPEPAAEPAMAIALAASSPALVVGSVTECERVLGAYAVVARTDRLADAIHVLSAGSVCFARAVNDTPKIAALLVATGGGTGVGNLSLLALAMAAGGLIASRRVAETMSHRITSLDPVEGLSANLATAGLVIAASRYGLPVSTTHVSCGSIFGIGLVTRCARWRTISRILAAWATTLPLGAVLGGLFYLLLRGGT